MTNAYQVFTGGDDKHGRQFYELQATYLNRARALDHCEEIVREQAMAGEHIENYVSSCGKYLSWQAVGFDIVTVCKMEEITITE